MLSTLGLLRVPDEEIISKTKNFSDAAVHQADSNHSNYTGEYRCIPNTGKYRNNLCCYLCIRTVNHYSTQYSELITTK